MLKGYYIIFVVNVVALTLGPHFMLLTRWRNTKLKRYVVIHELVTDILTDIPFFVVSLVGQTYINNVWITLDMVLKGVVFVRAMIWIPSQIANNIDQLPLEKAIKNVEMAANSNSNTNTNTSGRESQVKESGDDIDRIVSVLDAEIDQNQKSQNAKALDAASASIPKYQKCMTIVFCVVLTGGIVFALYWYLGWSVEQYELSLIKNPTAEPTLYPTIEPTTHSPTEPSIVPTLNPTKNPTVPTIEPTYHPTMEPTSPIPTPRYDNAGDWISSDNYTNLWFLFALLISACCLFACLCFAIFQEGEGHVECVVFGASVLWFSLFITFLVMLCAPNEAAAANDWIKSDHYKNIGFLFGFWISLGCFSLVVWLFKFCNLCDGAESRMNIAFIAALISLAMTVTFLILMS